MQAAKLFAFTRVYVPRRAQGLSADQGDELVVGTDLVTSHP